MPYSKPQPPPPRLPANRPLPQVNLANPVLVQRAQTVNPPRVVLQRAENNSPQRAVTCTPPLQRAIIPRPLPVLPALPKDPKGPDLRRAVLPGRTCSLRSCRGRTCSRGPWMQRSEFIEGKSTAL